MRFLWRQRAMSRASRSPWAPRKQMTDPWGPRLKPVPDDQPIFSIEIFRSASTSGATFKSMLERSLVAGLTVSRTPGAPLPRSIRSAVLAGIGSVSFRTVYPGELQRASDLRNRGGWDSGAISRFNKTNMGTPLAPPNKAAPIGPSRSSSTINFLRRVRCHVPLQGDHRGRQSCAIAREASPDRCRYPPCSAAQGSRRAGPLASGVYRRPSWP